MNLPVEAKNPSSASFCKRLRGGYLLLATTFVFLGWGANAADIDPQVHDGMSSIEISRALQALSITDENPTAAVVQPRTRRLRSSTTTVPTEPVLLLMERRRVKGSSERLADAWYYSYQTNETTHKIVDLTTGSIRSSGVVIDMQLPLVEAEISRAFDIVFSSTDDRSVLAQAYRQVTGTDFSERSQISYKAFVFHPDTVVDGLATDARRCGLNRCAQLLLYTHDNIALDMSPVVDLSTGRVLQNLELRAQEIVRREEAAL